MASAAGGAPSQRVPNIFACASAASLAACPHAECQPSRHGVVCAEWTRGSHFVPLSSIAGVRHLGSEKETTITTVCLSAPPDIMVARQLSVAHRLRTQLLRAQLMLHVLRHDLRPLRCASHRSTPLVRRTTIDAGVTRWRRSTAPRRSLFFQFFFLVAERWMRCSSEPAARCWHVMRRLSAESAGATADM